MIILPLVSKNFITEFQTLNIILHGGGKNFCRRQMNSDIGLWFSRAVNSQFQPTVLESNNCFVYPPAFCTHVGKKKISLQMRVWNSTQRERKIQSHFIVLVEIERVGTLKKMKDSQKLQMDDTLSMASRYTVLYRIRDDKEQ